MHAYNVVFPSICFAFQCWWSLLKVLQMKILINNSQHRHWIISSWEGCNFAFIIYHLMETVAHLLDSCYHLINKTIVCITRCIGPIQHLKNKYGRGYTLEVKVKPDRAPVSISSASSPNHSIPTQPWVLDHDG